MTNAPATKTNGKYAFWLSSEFYDKMRSYVSRHRNAPEDMTINQFVRDALENHLASALKKEGSKGGKL